MENELYGVHTYGTFDRQSQRRPEGCTCPLISIIILLTLSVIHVAIVFLILAGPCYHIGLFPSAPILPGIKNSSTILHSSGLVWHTTTDDPTHFSSPLEKVQLPTPTSMNQSHPHVLISAIHDDSNRLEGADAMDGSLLWAWQPNSSSRVLSFVALQGPGIIVAFLEDDQTGPGSIFTMSGIDIATGVMLWSQKMSTIPGCHRSYQTCDKQQRKETSKPAGVGSPFWKLDDQPGSGRSQLSFLTCAVVGGQTVQYVRSDISRAGSKTLSSTPILSPSSSITSDSIYFVVPLLSPQALFVVSQDAASHSYSATVFDETGGSVIWRASAQDFVGLTEDVAILTDPANPRAAQYRRLTDGQVMGQFTLDSTTTGVRKCVSHDHKQTQYDIATTGRPILGGTAFLFQKDQYNFYVEPLPQEVC